MCNVHAIRKYGVDLPVSFLGYTSTSCRDSVSSTLLFLYTPETLDKHEKNQVIYSNFH